MFDRLIGVDSLETIHIVLLSTPRTVYIPRCLFRETYLDYYLTIPFYFSVRFV